MASVDVRPLEEDQWGVLAWLWQCFRHDMAIIVSGLPYPDGRYQTRGLPERSSADVAGYLAWLPHPKTAEPAPVGFALVEGLTAQRRTLTALWVAPVVRRDGVRRRLARHVMNAHPGPWTVAFQHDNASAGRFWREVADEAFGAGAWREEEHQVPVVPDAPADHWIETL